VNVERWIAWIQKQTLTIGTIESFTGGGLAQALIQYPGASQWFFQGLVLYQTKAKLAWLGLKEGSIKAIDPVSQAMVDRLLKHAIKEYPDVIWLVTTGNAGPTASGHHPVGQVFLGIGNGQHQHIEDHWLTGTRQEIQAQGIESSLRMLKNFLSTYYKMPS
jgi:PncC family amidohydrolase